MVNSGAMVRGTLDVVLMGVDAGTCGADGMRDREAWWQSARRGADADGSFGCGGSEGHLRSADEWG